MEIYVICCLYQVVEVNYVARKKYKMMTVTKKKMKMMMNE